FVVETTCSVVVGTDIRTQLFDHLWNHIDCCVDKHMLGKDEFPSQNNTMGSTKSILLNYEIEGSTFINALTIPLTSLTITNPV
ncbi:hypothetical protein STEG23_004917, partial [Scotinomys teguina]